MSTTPSPSPSPSTSSPDRSWFWVAMAFVGFWVLYLVFFRPEPLPPLGGPTLNGPADFKWSAQDLQGQEVPFSRYQGKTVFLNVWATWCPPCIGEMPSIAELAKRPSWAGKNVEFVCVSVDESVETVRNYVKEKGWPMTVLWAGSLPPTFTTEGIPATFIISPEGKIVKAEMGAADWNQASVVSFLEKVASGTPLPSPRTSAKDEPTRVVR